MARVALVFVVLGLALGAAVLVTRAELREPVDLHHVKYATSSACGRCHPGHEASFRRTFHRTMTQDVSGVAAPFAGESVTYFGVTATARRDPRGKPELVIAGAHGEGETHFEVVRTVGSRRYQQYLARDGDVLVRLPVAFHVEEQRWFHLNGGFLTSDPELEGGHIARADYMRHVTRWNDNCIFCHNVGPSPGRDEDGFFASKVAELGVACEACHGPGEAHVAANSNPLRRYLLHTSATRDPTIVNPSRLSPERSADICGRCHGQRITPAIERFLEDGDPFVPGDTLDDYSRPLARDTTLRGEPGVYASRFWPDGTARLTAYEYQGLRDSPCAGLTCTSCHGMHEGDPRGQMRPSMLGDAQCTHCHEALESEAATRAHSRHAEVRCVDCHMPRIVYGLIDTHRSHRIEVPDARVTDRPDACTSCHVDETRRWAIDGQARLFGGSGSDEADAMPVVHERLFTGDPIERALAADALGRAPAADARVRTGLLLEAMRSDRYPAVRHLAARALGRLHPEVTISFVPESTPGERDAAVQALERTLAYEPVVGVDSLRARAHQAEVSIGE